MRHLIRLLLQEYSEKALHYFTCPLYMGCVQIPVIIVVMCCCIVCIVYIVNMVLRASGKIGFTKCVFLVK